MQESRGKADNGSAAQGARSSRNGAQGLRGGHGARFLRSDDCSGSFSSMEVTLEQLKKIG